MINIDQRHRMTRQEERGRVRAVFMAFIITIGFVALISDITETRAMPVRAEIANNLMSPERAEFMVLFEHGEEVEDGDMQ